METSWKERVTIKALYKEPTHSIAFPYLERFTYPWEALAGLSDYILELGATLPADEYDHPAEDIWIAKSATVSPLATLKGPLIVCPEADIRQCAFIRGSAIVGCHTVVGNSTELKNCILFDNVQVPHFNYVGDSILGYRSHMGAGSVTSNVKSDKSLVCIRFDAERIETERKKVGAMLGDFVEVGCNSVLNPGTVIGDHSNVYPLSSVRGFIPANHIFKSQNQIVAKKETI